MLLKYKPGFRLGRNTLIIILLSAMMMLGTVTGAVMANTINGVDYDKLSKAVSDILQNFTADEAHNKSDMFNEAIVKYGKILILIWFLGFVVYGIFFVCMIIFIKGLSYGFSAAFIIRQWGSKGIVYTLALYVPQNLILIPVYFCAAYFSINYALKGYINKKGGGNITLKEYVAILVICGALTLIAVLTEVFLSPHIVFRFCQ